MSPSDFLPFGISPETALSLGLGAAAFTTVIALGRAFVPHNPMGARIKAHARRRAQLRSQLIATPRRARQRHVGLLRNLVDRLKLTQGEESRSSAEKLAQAGLRSRDALVVFLSVRLILPLVLGIAAWVLFESFRPDMSTTYKLAGTVFGAVAGAYGPSLALGNMIKRRQKKIQKALPDALDLLVICAEAGLSLDGALTRVAREIGPATPELADELGLTAIELGFLPNRTEALKNLLRRTDMPSIRGVVNTLAQTERYGTPLASSLRVLTAEFRDARMMKAEEKAGRLPATLTVPMILFILPTLFVILVGPAAIQVVHTFRH
jgi:tight adherence protein C